jgi:hypothetical protein
MGEFFIIAVILFLIVTRPRSVLAALAGIVSVLFCCVLALAAALFGAELIVSALGAVTADSVTGMQAIAIWVGAFLFIICIPYAIWRLSHRAQNAREVSGGHGPVHD